VQVSEAIGEIVEGEEVKFRKILSVAERPWSDFVVVCEAFLFRWKVKAWTSLWRQPELVLGPVRKELAASTAGKRVTVSPNDAVTGNEKTC
jgi:hypothetical protein